MKRTIQLVICVVGFLSISVLCRGQILKDISNRIKQKTQQRADQKIDQTIDKGLDKAEGVGKKKDSSVTGSKTTTSDNKTSTSDSKTATTENKGSTQTENTQQTGFATYSKFDFVPGDKVIAVDEFSKD